MSLAAPSFSPMKYGLRSLIIAVTLVCVALGFLVARIEYLSRHALFHEDEAKRYTTPESDFETFQMRYSHTEIAREFRSPIARPWTTVDESPRPLPSLPPPPLP